jgi:signal transduction histidine kinase
MRSWPGDLAGALRQALGSPAPRAIGAVLSAGLAPGESGAFFRVEDGEASLLAAAPAGAPAGEPSVRALVARAAEESGPVVASAPGWPVACAMAAAAGAEVRGALVLLSRAPSGASPELRERTVLLATVLGGLLALDQARRRAQTAETRVGHLLQIARLAKPGRDLAEVGQALLDLAVELAGADIGALWARRRRAVDLRLTASRHARGRGEPRPTIGRTDVEPLIGAAPLVCPPSPPVLPRALLQDPKVDAALLFPLHHDGDLVGLLVLAREERAPAFAGDDVARIAELVEAAALPMVNACLRGEARARTRRLRVGRLLARAIGAGAALEVVVRLAVRELARVVPFDVALLAATGVMPDGGRMVVAEPGRRPRVRPNPADLDPAALPRHPLVIPDAGAADRPLDALARELPGARALLAAPVLAGRQLLGVLVLASRGRGRLRQSHLRHVRPVAEQLAAAVRVAGVRAAAAAAMEERRRLEQRLRRAEREAVLGRLSSTLAHEIRNPLTVIGATVQYLRDRSPIEHEHRALLETADRKVREMDQSLENLLIFMRPLDARPRPVAVDALVADVAAFVRTRAAQQGAAISIDVQPGLPRAYLDPRLLERAILTLAQTALDAMSTAGRLGFGLVAGPGDETLVLTVSDTGPGLDPDQLRAVFEPAFTTKRRGGGLGPALARRVVEEQGGSVEASSEPGRGTTFTLRLPVAPVADDR